MDPDVAGLELRGISKSFGAVQVLRGIDLDIVDGEFMVFVGPSGCGKSTTLRVIAGLEESSAGTLSIGGRAVQDVPAARRGVAMVFQSYALYPHMTVRDNLSFSLKLAGRSRADRAEAVARAAKILQIEGLLDRKPGALSGGQRQRVAIGRAIVRQPEVFLFDEPLSNLDAALRVQMRAELARLHRELGTTMVYVTHDQVEAMTLGHRIAVFNGGRIEQCDVPLALYERPATRFVAGFIGSPAMNFLGATLRSAASAVVAGAELPLAPTARLRPDTLVLGIRPEHVQLHAPGQGLSGTVDHVEHLGDQQLVHILLPHGERLLARLSAEQARPQPGEVVGLQLPPERLHLFIAEPSGQRID